MVNLDTSFSQDNLLNSVAYEGRLLSEWVTHFKLDFSGEGGDIFSTFMDRMAESYYLLSKIKPYVEVLERRLEMLHSETKGVIIEQLQEGTTKRLPNVEALDNMTRVRLKSKYEELSVAQHILSTFEVIVKKYDTLSYMVNKKYG